MTYSVLKVLLNPTNQLRPT